MPDLTPRLGLIKPDYDESADVEMLNDNADIIDGATGVSIVNSVVEITTPFNGQMAYELNTRQLRFFIQGEWLLIAAGDLNTGNPDRIRLPNGSIDDLADTTNAFQIGSDDGVNLAFDQDEIQARNNGAAAPLKLNEQGGSVAIGPNSEVKINNKGIVASSMVSKEQFDGSNISVTSNTYVQGDPDVTQDIEVPPSGKILVLLSGRGSVQTNGGIGYISYQAKKGSNDIVVAGAAGNEIQNRAAGNSDSNNLTSTVCDLVSGLTPGDDLTFKVMHKRSAGNVTFNIDFRKIILIPQI